MKLKIGLISDTHGLQHRIKVEACDILLHGGDISMQGRRDEVGGFLKWFAKAPATFKVFIAGNHERTFEQHPRPEWLEELLDPETLDKKGIHYLQDSGIELMGIKIWGCPWQPEFNNWAFNLVRGEELAAKYRLIPADTDILISHGPPYSIDDNVPETFLRPFETDVHVGCRDLFDHILQPSKLRLHVFGHIHLDDRAYMNPIQVKKARMETDHPDAWMTCVNAAVLNNKYQVTTQPYYFNYHV